MLAEMVMINLEPTISQIEKLLRENTAASVTYAALECRLAIERICYERLRLAHDYISHEDLRKWQPSDIVKTLIQEFDSKAAETFTLSIAREPMPEGSPPPTREDYEAKEWIPLGTQVGFAPNKLGKLWNGLAKLALHIEIPTSKDAAVNQYGDIQAIKSKVTQALAEIKRISEGTLMSSGMGEEVSFECSCGSRNKRRLELLKDGQTINCINPDCNESYDYVQSDMSFGRRTFDIICRACGTSCDIPKRMVEKLKTDQHIHFDCEGCREAIYVSWRPTQAQRTKSPAEA
ncbi:hypothetical protein [Pseudosulfitobacter pseudonitzschiae]|uniref:hypothetical protein n=2 Tax=Pseudosulfitobacter pseudonitzschiae TaxID=1402135 RepID=UPI001AF8814F|nr:hypothetical protein [Pseudosulfitobacter pseudonitzschiae]MBM1814297.1 hypothetical protein [Pseudosulfitobacter pseudonitzschiae]MBM1831290.1 hypothetical protein [Pseudosulfitobacter pseudonitzschiae]MBM1836157.1 hypothetical protein [Pseudosulfitobacter pseudonitzschiae]MBM1841003.1 hypothetical protein [Pseudosulfitobacter pseudonitzschiae]MBM1845008.1 hypothetical protein [Pseudosulfitobacter pseudonitzschiae]